MKKTVFLFFIFLFPLVLFSKQKENTLVIADSNRHLNVHIEVPDLIIGRIPFQIKFSCTDSLDLPESVSFKLQGQPYKVKLEEGHGHMDYTLRKKEDLSFVNGIYHIKIPTKPVPLWTSILPPLIAILFALLFKEVFSALLLGIFSGSLVLSIYSNGNPFIAGGEAFFNIITEYLLPSLADEGHLSIIVFSMLISGTVTVISKNGGVKGIVDMLARFARSARSGQLVTWLMGLLIFFDDYANTLIVGNTMRPVTDRLKISREKLAYIVDSTAAPVASLALITTWIGVELSYIQDGIETIGLNSSAYSLFLKSLDSRFYLIYTLIFMLFVIWMKRDFGPMHRAEIKARKFGIQNTAARDTEMDETSHTKSSSWLNAFIPIMVIIIATLAGLLITGKKMSSEDAGLMAIIGNADSYKALLWASFLGITTAIILSISQKLLNLKQSLDAAVRGFSVMLQAILILILAWALALVTEQMHTADFITRVLMDIQLPPPLLPTITFILAALIAISTGSSWGTMAILYPLILPAGFQIFAASGLSEGDSMHLFYNVISAVLAGAVLGDHCSPISDTTILSSLASSCNHIEHVRTQMPYALTVGIIAIVFGIIPSSYGVPTWIIYPIAILALYLSVRFVGRKVIVPN